MDDFRAQPWMTQGACYRMYCDNPEENIFFCTEDDVGGTGFSKVARAKLICAGCTVTLDCLAYAITNNIRHGVWGGMTEKQRRKARRRRTP